MYGGVVLRLKIRKIISSKNAIIQPQIHCGNLSLLRTLEVNYMVCISVCLLLLPFIHYFLYLLFLFLFFIVHSKNIAKDLFYCEGVTGNIVRVTLSKQSFVNRDVL